MAALTADRNTPRLLPGETIAVPVGASAVIYAGALVALSATGFAVAAALAPGLTPLGRAEARVDNTGGADGAKLVEVRSGVFRFNNSAAAEEIKTINIGDRCYIVDDQTVARTSNDDARSVAGIVRDVDVLGVWVDVDPRLFAGEVIFNPAQVSATALYPLGTRARMPSGREYVYVEADANIAAKAWAAVHGDFTADPLDTGEAATIHVGRPLGIAAAALTAASTKFGWLAIYGTATGLSEDATAGVRLKATSTAGTVDDDAGAETGIVKGAILLATVSGGAGEGPFALNYPYIDTDLDT